MEQGDDYVEEQVDGMFKTFYCDMIDDCDRYPQVMNITWYNSNL